MSKRTPFGTMLNNYRFQKSEVIRKLKAAMLKKAGLDHPQYEDKFEFRESTVAAQDGSTTTQVELWKRIDVERVKVSTSVVAEKVEEEKKDEEDWS